MSLRLHRLGVHGGDVEPRKEQHQVFKIQDGRGEGEVTLLQDLFPGSGSHHGLITVIRNEASEGT